MGKIPFRLEQLMKFESLALEIKSRDIQRSGKQLYWKPEKLREYADEKEGEPFLVIVYRFEEKKIKCYFIPLKKANELTVGPVRRDDFGMKPYDEKILRPYLVFDGTMHQLMSELFTEARIRKDSKAFRNTSEKFAEDIVRFILELVGFRVNINRRKGDGYAYRP